MADNDERTTLVVPRRSFIDVVREHPFVFAAAALLGAAVIGTVLFLYSTLSGDEEAPIRVKSGSIDLFLLTNVQEWKAVGGSDNWTVSGATRFTDDFEVTVAVKEGATCGGSLTATGSDVVFTYNNGGKIRIRSQSRHTMVKPENNATLTRDANDLQRLTYVASGGFIQTIAVGNGANPTTMCTFTDANQLDHALILNVPQ